MNICKSIILLIIIFITGCAHHIVFEKETISSMQSVTVSEVMRPDHVSVDIGAGGGMGGLLAGYARGVANQQAKKVEGIIKKEVPHILREKFVKELKKSNLFEYIGSNETKDVKPDAKFVILIIQYGFHSPQLFSKKCNPKLYVVGALVLNPQFEYSWRPITAWRGYKFEVKDPDRHPIVWRVLKQTAFLNYQGPSIKWRNI